MIFQLWMEIFHLTGDWCKEAVLIPLRGGGEGWYVMKLWRQKSQATVYENPAIVRSINDLIGLKKQNQYWMLRLYFHRPLAALYLKKIGNGQPKNNTETNFKKILRCIGFYVLFHVAMVTKNFVVLWKFFQL